MLMNEWMPGTSDDDESDRRFERVMIEVIDWDRRAWQYHAWLCRVCRWLIVTNGAPPGHFCPDDGEQQVRRRKEAEADGTLGTHADGD